MKKNKVLLLTIYTLFAILFSSIILISILVKGNCKNICVGNNCITIIHYKK